MDGRNIDMERGYRASGKMLYDKVSSEKENASLRECPNCDMKSFKK